MASLKQQRLGREVLDRDQLALQRVSELPDYAPAKDDLSVAALRAREADMIEARQAEDRVQRELKAARERSIAASKAFHEGMKGMAAQVLAQYGENSLALRAVGRKRRSDFRPPTRRSSAE